MIPSISHVTEETFIPTALLVHWIPFSAESGFKTAAQAPQPVGPLKTEPSVYVKSVYASQRTPKAIIIQQGDNDVKKGFE